MVSLLEHLKLLFHKVDEDLVLLNRLLNDDLDGTRHTSLLVEAFTHLAEGAFA